MATPTRRTTLACWAAGLLLVFVSDRARAASWGVESIAGHRVVTSYSKEFQAIHVYPGASIAEHGARDVWLVPAEGGGAFVVGRREGAPVAVRVDVDGVVSQAAFSPSGRRAVLVVRPSKWRPGAEAQAGTLREFHAFQRTRLVVVSIGARLEVVVDAEPLGHSASTDWNPVWLDESRVLFQSLRTGLASFFVAELSDRRGRQLTNRSPMRGRLGHARAVPVAVRDGLVRVDDTTVLFTTRTQAGDEVWRLSLRDGLREPEAGWVMPGSLGNRLENGRFEIVRDGRVVAELSGDGTVERRAR